MSYAWSSIAEHKTWASLRASEIFEDVNERNRPELEVLTIKQGVGTVPRAMSGIDIKFNETSRAGYKRVQAGDFIIHLRSFQGGLEMANCEGIVSAVYTILRNKKPVNRDFYRAYFHSNSFIHRDLSKAVEGIRDGRQIKYRQFKTTRLPYPPIEEQNIIGKCFSLLDKATAIQKRKVSALADIKKGMLQKIFSQELRFKDDKGGEFPVWDRKRLGDYYSKIPTGKAHKCVNGKFLLYGSTGVLGKTNDLSATGKKILIARVGTAGKVNFNEIDCGITDNTLFITDDCAFINIKWLYYFLDFYNLPRFTFGTSQPMITATLVKEIIMSLPALPEQQKIAAYFSHLDNLLRAAREKLTQLQEIKKGLLQRMFI